MTLKNNKERVIFLFGPTAVGKTELLCSLFSSGYEVVNADSVQVYRGLNIGSAKADSSVTDVIPHHLIDILDPWESFNVADFIRLADCACEKIRSNGNIPILCGGTAYYFKHYIYGLSEAPKADLSIRNEVSEWMKEVGLRQAYEYLSEIDFVSTQRINPNDAYRISRAIEVYKTSGKPLSFYKVPSKPRQDMDIIAIGLCRDRDVLAQRIRLRVDKMFKDGLVDEVSCLVKNGANLSWQSMQAIGYKEFFQDDGTFNPDCLDLNKIKERIIMNSIHYAKRQMTFFRGFADVHWIEADANGEVSRILEKASEGN